MNRFARLGLCAVLAALVVLGAGPGLGKEPPNLSQTLRAVEAYYHSGQYEKDLSHVAASARAYLLERVQRAGKEKPALVLDIDDTSLSWLEPVEKAHFCLSAVDDRAVVMRAELKPILPTLKLFRLARQKGVAVFFITGRPEITRRFTEKNLKRAGYEGWAGLYLHPTGVPYDSEAPVKTAARKEITQRGYAIILNMGDQESDLAGGYAERTFKLPNCIFYYP